MIAVAVIEPERLRLTYAGIGNIEARLRQNAEEHRLVNYRGIVGAHIPTVRSFELALAPDWLLVLHTDGVSSHFQLDESLAFRDLQPQALAEALLAEWSRPTDDATVVVIRPDEDVAAPLSAPADGKRTLLKERQPQLDFLLSL